MLKTKKAKKKEINMKKTFKKYNYKKKIQLKKYN